MAGAAGASLGNLLARAETDHSLRRRLAELQALARLAEQITRLTEEDPILDEVLAAVQVLAGLEGAVYAVERDGSWTPHRAAGLDAAAGGRADRARSARSTSATGPARTTSIGAAGSCSSIPMPGAEPASAR